MVEFQCLQPLWEMYLSSSAEADGRTENALVFRAPITRFFALENCPLVVHHLDQLLTRIAVFMILIYRSRADQGEEVLIPISR